VTTTGKAAKPDKSGSSDDAGQQDTGDAADSASEDITWPEPAAPTVSVAVLGPSARGPARPVPPVPGRQAEPAAPADEDPATDAVGSDGPVGTDAPGTDAPGTDAPGTDAPDGDGPGSELSPGESAGEPGTPVPSGQAPATVAAPVIGAVTGDAEDTDGGDEADADDATEADTADSGLVSVIRGVPRYHERDCVLIRFMPEGDIQKLSVAEASAAGCTPCAACQPEQ
jgi:hypothetical protein